MTPRTIRFKLDRTIQAAAVPSEFWAGSPFRIESAVFRDDGDIEDTFSDVASFQLVIARQRNSATALVTKSVDVADLTACTAEEWDDGSGQHVAFDIASDESAVALTGDAERVWWEVRAILSGGGYDVLGGGLITANQDATADIAADAIAYYYTKAEVDALIAGAGGGGGSMTASQILTALKTVDGTGSGLDADLLDGQSAAAFATASHTHTFSSLTSKPTTISGYGITDAATSASVATVANDLDSYIGDQLTWNTNQESWNTSTGNAITALEARAEIPSQSGNSGKVLTTDGSTLSWTTMSGGSGLPDMSGHDGHWLRASTGIASWESLPDFAMATDLSDFIDTQLTVNSSVESSLATLDSNKVTVNGALGSPSSGTLTGCTGLPISGIAGLGTGVATLLATPTSDNLRAAVTDETGTGALVFATSPTLVTPALGTPSSGTLTNCTGLPVGGISATGTPSSSTYLRGDGSWATVSGGSLPSQTGNSGKWLTTDGTNASWSSSSAVLDGIGSTRGQIVYRGASAWSALPPGAAGHYLKGGGAGADPSWAILPVYAGAGAGAAAGGYASTAAGSHAFAFGFQCQAPNDMSQAFGTYAKSEVYSSIHQSGGRFFVSGDSQTVVSTFRVATTDTTPTELFANGSSERFTIKANTVALCDIRIVAKQSSSTNCATFARRATLCRDGSNNTSLVGSVETIGTDVNSPGWAVAITADDTNESLKISVTGGSAVTVRWTASIIITELTA